MNEQNASARAATPRRLRPLLFQDRLLPVRRPEQDRNPLKSVRRASEVLLEDRRARSSLNL